MSDNKSYTVEKAKSTRSSCRKCKQKIEKDSLRIGTIIEDTSGRGFNSTQWFHVPCFGLPRAFTTGPEKKTVQEFCQDVLNDSSGGAILRQHMTELVEQIGKDSKRKASAGGDGNENAAPLLKEIIARYEAKPPADAEESAPKKKKAKTKGGPDDGDDDVLVKQVEAYEAYHKSSNVALKDVLTWNKQVKAGTKDFLLLKCIDGYAYGRLARCGLCDGGKLKLLEDGCSVICMGGFDEDTHTKLSCAFNCLAKDAPRFQPWYNHPPTEEEDAEMETLIEGAKGEAENDTGNDPDVEKLIKAANKKFPDWELVPTKKLLATAQGLVELFRAHPGKKVDIPDDAKEASKVVGTILAANTHKAKSAADIIPVLVDSLGFVENKEAKAAKKQGAIATAVKNEANAELVGAFSELADLYCKLGDARTGKITAKVAAALAKLEFAVTEENALRLGKGKTKVEDIGAKSAEKIHEFVTTGKMDKLEEKRAIKNAM